MIRASHLLIVGTLACHAPRTPLVQPFVEAKVEPHATSADPRSVADICAAGELGAAAACDQYAGHPSLCAVSPAWGKYAALDCAVRSRCARERAKTLAWRDEVCGGGVPQPSCGIASEEAERQSQVETCTAVAMKLVRR